MFPVWIIDLISFRKINYLIGIIQKCYLIGISAINFYNSTDF